MFLKNFTLLSLIQLSFHPYYFFSCGDLGRYYMCVAYSGTDGLFICILSWQDLTERSLLNDTQQWCGLCKTERLMNIFQEMTSRVQLTCGEKNSIHNLSPYFKRWRLRYISSMGNSIFKTVSIIHFVFLWTYKALLCLLHEYTKTLEMY